MPILTITGLSNSHYGYESLRSGVHLFPDARIEVSNADAAAAASEEDDDDSSSEGKIISFLFNLTMRLNDIILYLLSFPLQLIAEESIVFVKFVYSNNY